MIPKIYNDWYFCNEAELGNNTAAGADPSQIRPGSARVFANGEPLDWAVHQRLAISVRPGSSFLTHCWK